MAQLTPQFLPQAWKERKLGENSRSVSKGSQIRLQDPGRCWQERPIAQRAQGKATKDFFQRARKFRNRDGLPLQLIFKVVKDRLGGVPDKFRIK